MKCWDVLILPGHQGIPNVEQCVYFGHLANEPEACVAMTGCAGSEDVELTILSTHNEVSHTFKWLKEGDVEILRRRVLMKIISFIHSAIIIFYEMKGGKMLRSRIKASNIPALHWLIFLFDFGIHRTLYRIINCISKSNPKNTLGSKFDLKFFYLSFRSVHIVLLLFNFIGQ